jgi:hypothetical protein
MSNITSKYVGYFYLVKVLFLLELQKKLYWKLFAARYIGIYVITICLNRCVKIR